MKNEVFYKEIYFNPDTKRRGFYMYSSRDVGYKKTGVKVKNVFTKRGWSMWLPCSRAEYEMYLRGRA